MAVFGVEVEASADVNNGRAAALTTEGSLLDLVFLMDKSILLGLVGGRSEVQYDCYGNHTNICSTPKSRDVFKL